MRCGMASAWPNRHKARVRRADNEAVNLVLPERFELSTSPLLRQPVYAPCVFFQVRMRVPEGRRHGFAESGTPIVANVVAIAGTLPDVVTPGGI